MIVLFSLADILVSDLQTGVARRYDRTTVRGALVSSIGDRAAWLRASRSRSRGVIFAAMVRRIVAFTLGPSGPPQAAAAPIWRDAFTNGRVTDLRACSKAPNELMVTPFLDKQSPLGTPSVHDVPAP